MLKVSKNTLSKTKVLRFHDLRHSTKTTVDDCQIDFFNKQSHHWWDETGSIKPLHTMNLLRVPFIRDCLISTGAVKKEFLTTLQPLRNLRILDVGCGGGLLSEAIAKLGCTVVGLDASRDLIAIAKEHASRDKSLTNLNYESTTIEEFSLQNREEFDAVISSEVLEHVNDVPGFITECVKCLNPGGSIVFTTINKTFLSKVYMVYICEYITSTIPKGTHEFEKFVEPALIQKVLRDSKLTDYFIGLTMVPTRYAPCAGFDEASECVIYWVGKSTSDNCCPKSVRGMFLNPFTKNWSWISSNAFCYALHGIKMTK